MSYSYQYPRMLVTVDCLVFLKDYSSETRILLVKRRNDPYKGFYALPGGFPEMNELLEKAAERELFEETGLNGVQLTQFKAFDKVNRDPRDRNIAIAFYGFTTSDNSAISAGDDAEYAEWFSIRNLPPLAFDHEDIIGQALLFLNL